jgi:response regulator of citrate/malate metabolism
MSRKIQSYIANGKTELALSKLVSVSKKYAKPSLQKEVCVLSGSFKRLESAFSIGILDYAERDIRLNKINTAILQFSEEIKILKKKPKQSQI